jgi:hypothetical protein
MLVERMKQEKDTRTHKKRPTIFSFHFSHIRSYISLNVVVVTCQAFLEHLEEATHLLDACAVEQTQVVVEEIRRKKEEASHH